MDLDRHETARRMRALRGYSLMGQIEFAEALGVDPKKAERFMRTSGATRTPDDILRRAARIAGLPEDFATGEFGQVGVPAEDVLSAEDVRAIVAAELAARSDDDEQPGAGRQAPGAPAA